MTSENEPNQKYICIPKEALPAPIRIINTTIKVSRQPINKLKTSSVAPCKVVLENKPNFVVLPDNSEIIMGTMNILHHGEHDLEIKVPFVCIVAAIVAKKYKITDWSKDIMDYVIRIGVQLFHSSNAKKRHLSNLEIPRLIMGKTHFQVNVCHIFHGIMKGGILEAALKKKLFVISNCGIIKTLSYTCMVYHKEKNFYLYDCFPCNETGLGVSTNGVACMLRFKTLHAMVSRVIYNKNKREVTEDIAYKHFDLNAVFVKKIFEMDKEENLMADKATGEANVKDETLDTDSYLSDEENEEEDDTYADKSDTEDEAQLVKYEPPLKKRKGMTVGWKFIDNHYMIEGTMNSGRLSGFSNFLEVDFFVCLCANLMLLNHPLSNWDTKKINEVVRQGQLIYSNAVGRDIATKKCIENVLINDYFFSLITKEIQLKESKGHKNHKTLDTSINTLVKRGFRNFIIQYHTCCFSLYFDYQFFYIFDPNHSPNSCWIKFSCFTKLLKYISDSIEKFETYHLHQHEILSFGKAPKALKLQNRSESYKMIKIPQVSLTDPDLHENITWSLESPIPWSKCVIKPRKHWHQWNVEIVDELYSLYGTISQFNEQFGEYQGKQTFAVLACALAMMEVYDFLLWNPSVLDTIVLSGHEYFKKSMEERRSEPSAPVELTDLKETFDIFPYKFKVKFEKSCDGIFFAYQLDEMNLAKALRYFFKGFEKRYGIIMKTNEDERRIVAFGKKNDCEYFMFDTECDGLPIFPEPKSGSAYILKTFTMFRLMECMVHILKSGNFYITDVDITKIGAA